MKNNSKTLSSSNSDLKLDSKVLAVFTNKIFWHVLIILLATLVLSYRFIILTAVGHDYLFHLANIFALNTAFSFEQTSLVSTQILPIIFHDLGYGIRIFYPPLAHLLPVLISTILRLAHITSSIPFAIKVFQTGVIFCAGISMYYATSKITKNSNSALISAIVYLSFPYFLSEFYIRSALAEGLCFVALPIVFLSIFYFLNKRYQAFFYAFIFSLAMMLYSHLITTFYTVLIAGTILIFNYRLWMNKKEAWTILIKASIILLLICSPLLIAIFQQRFASQYVIFNDENLRLRKNVAMSTISPWLLFNFGKDGTDIVFTINSVAIILIILAIIFYKKIVQKISSQTKPLLTALVTGAICIFFACFSPIWNYTPRILNFIQFPWRLFVFVSGALSFVAGTPFLLLKKNKFNYLLLGATILAIITISYLSTSTVRLEELHNIDHSTAASLSAVGNYAEYLPITAKSDMDYLAEREQAKIKITSWQTYDETSNETVIIPEIDVLTNKTPYLLFTVQQENPNSIVTLELPRIYYLGYQINLIDGNGNKSQLNYWENEKGLIEVQVIGEGTIEVNYSGTLLYQLSLVISITTLIGVLIYFGVEVKRYRLK